MKIRTLALFLGAMMGALCLRAQQFDNPVQIPISFYGSAESTLAGASFSFGGPLGATASGGTGTAFVMYYAPTVTGSVIPGQVYTVTTTSNHNAVVIAYFAPVDGCTIFINGVQTYEAYISGGSGSFTVRVEKTADISHTLSGKRGGECSSFPEDKPIWYIGLGSLRTGVYAGALGFRMPLITSSLFSTSALVCGVVDASEVSVTRTGGNITQVVSRDVVLNVSGPTAPYTSGYTIQACQSATPSTPFITYYVSPYTNGGVNGVRIDKVESGATWSTVLIQTGSPATAWTLYDWRLGTVNTAIDTSNPITTTVSGATSTVDYGTSPGQIVKQKNYTTIGSFTELASVTYGPGGATPQTTSYTYYSSSSSGGWYDAVATRVDPTGKWTAYDYYDAANDTRQGQVNHVYRPWLNAPLSPGYNTSSGYVETYNYAANYDGTTTAVSSKVVTINGVTAGQTTWAYNWGYEGAVNGSHVISQTVETDSISSSSSLVTTTLAYLPNDSITFFQNKVHSVTHPDGTKESYAYYFGTWNSSTNTFAASSTGNDRLILTFHGQSTAGTGSTQIGSWTWTTGTATTWTMDPLYMVTDLSTVTETVVDTNGHQVFTSQDIYNGGTDIERISGTNNSFNGNNLLATATDIERSVPGTNGTVAVSYAYTGGIPTTKTDIDGTVTTTTLDNYRRPISVRTTSGNTSVYPTVTQAFTYYASNLKNTGQEKAGSPTVTTYTYDTAGRLLSSSVPNPMGGTLTTSLSYPSATQTIQTLPTGATLQTDLYLDGKTADKLGTGQVPSYFNYACNSSGQIVATTQHDSALANGWTQDTMDWLGRKVTEKTPEWGYGSTSPYSSYILQKAYSYNGSGQLSSVATTDVDTGNTLLPLHIYLYGNMGMLTEEGDDVNNTGALEASSTDRIKLYNTYFYKDTGGFNGWLKCDQVQVYNTPNQTGLTTTSQTSTRYTEFNSGALYGSARVLSDVTTLDASGRYTVDWTYSDSGAQTTTHLHEIEGATNGGLTVSQNGHTWTDKSISGVLKTYAYNGLGQPASVTEGTTGSYVSYTYYAGTDQYETTTNSTGASSSTTSTYSYAWNTSTNSNVVGVTDAAGNTSYTENNALGLPWHVWGTGAQPSLTGYDAYGRKTSLTTWQNPPLGTFTGASWPGSPPAGNTTTWTLDGSTGATNKKTFADSTSVNFTYNARGQMATRTWARGVTTTYSYFNTPGSLTGELQEVGYSDGTTPLYYTYTRFGKIATVQDATGGTRTLAYRNDLKVASISLPSFYNSYTLTENYDSMGRVTGYSYALNANQNQSPVVLGASYAFDPATARWIGNTGNVGSTSAAFTFSYAAGTDWVNSVTDGSYSRSMPLVAGYDVISSVTTNFGSNALGSFSSAYTDSRGWRSTQTIGGSGYAGALGLGSSLTSTYGYDSFGELTSSINAGANTLTLDWNFDLIGNRTSETDSNPGASTSYTANSTNEYSAITGALAEATLAFDADGNMTQDGTWIYAYDAENRIKSMTNASNTITFAYDYKGRRISKTVNGAVTKFLWQGWTLAADLNSDGVTPKRSYFWGPDFSDSTHGKAGGAGSLLAEIDSTSGNAIYYAVPDVYGNIAGYANGSGTVVDAVLYSPFGRALSSANTSGGVVFPIGFSGQYTDWETNLVYYGKRFYNPKHGRFINRDPIEEEGGNNLYAFVRNAPINGWDFRGCIGIGAGNPSGLCARMAYLSAISTSRPFFTTKSEYNQDSNEGFGDPNMGGASDASALASSAVLVGFGGAPVNSMSTSLGQASTGGCSVPGIAAVAVGDAIEAAAATDATTSTASSNVIDAPNNANSSDEMDPWTRAELGDGDYPGFSSKGTQVTNGFVQVGGTDGTFYHTVVMLTDPTTGQTYIAEANPQYPSVLGGINRFIPGASGSLVADIAPYDPSVTVIVTTQPLGTVGGSLDDVYSVVRNFNQIVNNNAYTYLGEGSYSRSNSNGGYNSNNYATSVDEQLGFILGTDPVYAPGYGTPLPPIK